MIEALLGALVLVTLIALFVLDTAQARANAMLNETHAAFGEERRAWTRERQILLNRIQSPETGIAQSLYDGPTADDVSFDHASEYPTT